VGGVNVGPTFHNPEGSQDDDTSLPQRIDWISKNPDPGEGESLYEKTIVWTIPPRAYVGHISRVIGGYKFRGDFVPPGTRTPKDAESLDEDEKDRFKRIFENEQSAVDEFHEKVKAPKPEPAKITPKAAGVLGTANVLSSALALHTTIHLPPVPRAGSIINATVSATTSLNGVNLGPTPIARADWTLGGRTYEARTRLRLRLVRSGRFRITVAVRDKFAAYGAISRIVVVRPRR
jgi:hypothetical protein